MVLLNGSKIETSAQLRILYKENLTSFGFSAKALFYRNEDQHIRKLTHFAETLAGISDVESSILDIGCGWGALLEFFSPGNCYLGIDLVEEFITEAQRRFPRRKFKLADITEFSSGTFDICVLAGVLSSVPAPLVLLEKALRIAKVGVLFDITVTDRLPRDFEGLNRLDEHQIQATASNCGYDSLTRHDAGASWLPYWAARGKSI